MYALRSALRCVIELGDDAPTSLIRWLQRARRKGLLGTAHLHPNGARAGDEAGATVAWVGSVGTLADVARHLPGRLVVNAHFFAITPWEQPSPHAVLGDPVGATARSGLVTVPPVARRAALLHDGTRWRTAVLDPNELVTEVPGVPKGARPVARFVRSAQHPNRVHTDRVSGIVDLAIVDRTVVGRFEGGGAPIPPTGWVLRFEAPLPRDTLSALRRGVPVRHRLAAWPSVRTVVQGGPRLVSHGRVVCDDATLNDEGFVSHETPASPVPSVFPADAARTRAARLGVGVRADGTLVVIAVEGRSSRDDGVAEVARGATLVELAGLLVEAGAVEGINLDGGGSVQAYLGSGALLRGADQRGTDHARYVRLVPTGLAFA